jgi:hypothetical protein
VGKRLQKTSCVEDISPFNRLALQMGFSSPPRFSGVRRLFFQRPALNQK